MSLVSDISWYLQNGVWHRITGQPWVFFVVISPTAIAMRHRVVWFQISQWSVTAESLFHYCLKSVKIVYFIIYWYVVNFLKWTLNACLVFLVIHRTVVRINIGKSQGLYSSFTRRSNEQNYGLLSVGLVDIDIPQHPVVLHGMVARSSKRLSSTLQEFIRVPPTPRPRFVANTLAMIT